VSEGERLVIQALDAGARGDVAAQRGHLTRLVEAFPGDERAHNLMGLFLFGAQDYQGAIAEFKRATAINPAFSQPYNMLGYSYRFLGRFQDAESAFKAYVKAIPTDPNPHDSYAELLLKMGRFEESIANYRKALAIDRNFAPSYIGIGHAQMFTGKGDEARATFADLGRVARNDGERRQAMFWTAMSWIHDGQPHRALAELETMYAIAEVNGDTATMSNDLLVIGNVLLAAGRPDEAQRRYAERRRLMDGSSVPEDVKQATRRNTLFNEARVAIARNDLAGARAKAAEFARLVAERKNPNEIRQQHELAGRIALAAGDGAAALAELKKANQQDPQVLFLQARALETAGDADGARAAYRRVATFNGLFPTYVFVRPAAVTATKG
jgi:tetratricopeptide (TPR) repeat protein